jgi:hypothetical protein
MSGISPRALALAGGLDLSTAQSATLKAFSGEPLDGPELRAFRAMAGVTFKKPSASAYSELWVEAGRRGGKTTHIAAPVAVTLALIDDAALSSLAPGEKARVLCLGPTILHVRQLFDAVEGLLEKLHVPHARTESEITLPGRRVTITCTTADHIAVRSGTLLGLVVDEAALLPTEEIADGYDVELFASARPGLATLAPHARIVVISSPWARRGVHFETVRANRGKLGGNILALNAPTWILNPSISEERSKELEPNEARRRREYGAVAGASEDAFLDARDVRACVDVDVDERPAQPQGKYVVGFDLGLRRDRSAIVVAHREHRRRPNAPPLDCVVIDCIRIFSPSPGERLSFDMVVDALANISHRYKGARVVRDNFSGDAVDAALRARGVRSEELPMSSTAQWQRFEMLSQKIRGGAVRLLDGRDGNVLARELIDLRVELHQRGRVSVAAPNKKGAHDDAADALALAVEAAMKLPATGGDIRAVTSISRIGSHLSFDTRFQQRVTRSDGRDAWVPSGPPVGSLAWRELREQQRAQGIVVLDDAEAFEADQKQRSLNVRIR